MKNALQNFFVVIFLLSTLTQCKPDKAGNGNTVPPALTDATPVKGYALLSKVCGIWNGPVTSTTHLGSFPEAPMDFRPISAAQVSCKNDLDPNNSLFMSFFIVYTGSEYQVAFRNGGTFAGMIRTSYMTLDSVLETQSASYYRFVDFKKGAQRAITEVSFWDDSMHIRVFTNKNNTQASATIHMDYRAGLQTADAYQAAKTALSFPKKQLVKDFSTTFQSVTESIFYAVATDPYPETAQPYLGKATLSYTFAPNITIVPGAQVILLASTQPLIGGTGPILANYKTRSRYVIITNPTTSFVFNYMHPGSYYLYALADNNSNGIMDSGDFVSTANTAFSLTELGTVSQSTQINFQIP